MDWKTARHDQPPETATTQRRRYQVTPAMTRSGSPRTGMSEAFALLEADEQMVRSLATRPEANGDPKIPAALACNLETPETNAQAHAGPNGRIWRAAERKEFAGRTAIGTSKPSGVSVWRSCNRVSPGYLSTFLAANTCFCLLFLYFLGVDLILLV